MLVAHLQSKASAPAASAPAAKSSGDKAVDVAAAMAHKFQPTKSTYTAKDVMLYALGVGDRPDPAKYDDLGFVYENHPNFRVLPTMGVIFPFDIMAQVCFHIPLMGASPYCDGDCSQPPYEVPSNLLDGKMISQSPFRLLLSHNTPLLGYTRPF
jgi:hypothetical protein